MDYYSLHMKTVVELRKIAKENGVKLPTGIIKEDIVARILEKTQPQPSAAPDQSAISTATPAKRRGRPPVKKAEPQVEGKATPEGEPAAEAAEAAAVVPTKRRGRPSKKGKPEETEAKAQHKVELNKIDPQVQNEAAQGEPVAVVSDAATEVVEIKKTAVVAETVETAEAPFPAHAEGDAGIAGVATEAAAEDAGAGSGSASPEAQDAEQQPEKAREEATSEVSRTETRQRYVSRRDLNPQRPAGRQQNYSVRTPYNRSNAQPGRPQNRFGGENGARVQRGNENQKAGAQDEAQRGRFHSRTEDAPQPVRRANAAEEAPAVNAVVAEEQQRRSFAQEERNDFEDVRTANLNVSEMVAAGDCGEGEGILEIHPDGYGFLRAENYLPGNRDVYVSGTQIRRFNLRAGDHIKGKTRPQQLGDRSVGLIYINEVNGLTLDRIRGRRRFDALVPIYPEERLRMETADARDMSLRIIDMIAPIGKGQRGIIVSPPKAGKTTLLKKIAHAITTNNPEVHLIVLLIDERPEEVTDMKRSIRGEVVYSTFDEAPENHTRVSEMVLERAQRLVELGKDVVVLLDSITRLARAYNLVIPPTGRSLSGGLDPGALFKPKRFFGAARNIENGGSLTIIATALVDTGSRMDDIIFEEFKGTGNMELHLDRSLSDRRIFPAIDMYRSGTRREELLMNAQELECAYQVRRMLSRGSAQDSAEQLISMLESAKNNQELFQKMQSWKAVCEKEGYTK